MSEEEKPEQPKKKKGGKRRKKSVRNGSRKPRRERIDAANKSSSVKRPDARTPKTEARKVAFLKHVATTGDTFAGACRKLKLSRSTYWEWRKNDPAFEEALDQAYKDGTEVLIQEAKRRAFKGWLEPVHYQGERTGVVRKFDSTLLMFLIKQRDPSFRDPKYAIPVTPPRLPGEVTLDLDKMPPALLEQLEKEAQRQAAEKQKEMAR